MSEAADYSALFEPSPGIYLLSHSVGRLPRVTRARVEADFFAPWAEGRDEPWQAWLGAIDGFREALARLFATEAELLCPQPNLSSALARIVSALPPVAGRNTILLSEDDFPSLGFVLQQAQRLGYALKYLPAAADTCQLETWQESLSEDVGMALITHVQSNAGRRAPMPELLAELRSREIISVVDVAQSAGVIPIDLEQWQASFVIGSCVKWLCGGPGAGFLWANREILPRCQPLDVGWFSHQQPFEFDIHNFRYHPGALRFWGGTPSVLPYVCASAGIELLLELGMAQVYAHNCALRSRLRAQLDPSVLVSPADDAACGGTLIVNFGAEQSAMATRLQAAGVSFDLRKAGMRLSPHLYNSEAEISRVIDCLG